MLAIVGNRTVANQFQRDKTIGMTVNDWHAHSVLKMRGKKRIQNLTHNDLFDMWSLKCSFFSINVSTCPSGSLQTEGAATMYELLMAESGICIVFRASIISSFTSPLHPQHVENFLSFREARIMFRAYESSNNHLLSKKKNNINLFGHFSSVRLNYLHANQLKQVQTK